MLFQILVKVYAALVKVSGIIFAFGAGFLLSHGFYVRGGIIAIIAAILFYLEIKEVYMKRSNY